jgi:hypothetical protein
LACLCPLQAQRKSTNAHQFFRQRNIQTCAVYHAANGVVGEILSNIETRFMIPYASTQKPPAKGWNKFNSRKPLGFGLGAVFMACAMAMCLSARLSAQDWAHGIVVSPHSFNIYAGESVNMTAAYTAQYFPGFGGPPPGIYGTSGSYGISDPHIEDQQGNHLSVVISSFGGPNDVTSATVQWTSAPFNTPGTYTYNVNCTPYIFYHDPLYNYYDTAYGPSDMNYGQATVSVIAGVPPTFITQPPAAQTIPNGLNTSVTVEATTPIGADPQGNISQQWQISTDNGSTWSNLSSGGQYTITTFTGYPAGEVTDIEATLKITGVTAGMNGNQFRNVASDSFGSTPSSAMVLTVAPGLPVSITSQPAGQTIRNGPILNFSVVAGGSPPFTYQWELSTDGGTTWTNLSDGGAYSGTSTATLTINTIPSMVGYEYAVVVSNPYGPSVVSSAAIILSASVPVLPYWALASLIALVFFGARATLGKKYRTV